MAGTSRFLLLITLLACLAVSARAEDDFRPLVSAAVRSHAQRVVIPPGVYRMAPHGGDRTVWSIDKAHDIVIVADGVTLVSTQLTRAIDLRDCRNVTLQGITVDYDPLPFTQGTVTAVAGDKSWVDVKIHAGYPLKAYSRIDVVDPATRIRKRGMPFLWGSKAVMTGADTVRITREGLGKIALVGDFISMSTGPDAAGIPHAVTIDDCAGVIFRNVTVDSAPGMGIIESGGEGGAQYLGCKVAPGPRPAGATQDRLLSTSWDAIQTADVRRGPLVEHCLFRDAGDDSWSVQSSDYLVAKSDSRHLVIFPRDEYAPGLSPGDRIRTSLDSPEAAILSSSGVSMSSAGLDPATFAKLNDAREWSFWKVGHRGWMITLDRDFSAAPGTSIYSPDRQCAGFIFRDNELHSSGRVLIKAGNGLVAGNLLDPSHGLVVNPEVPGQAAAGIRNLVIRDNTIRGTGFFCPGPFLSQAGAISITAGMAGGHLRPPGVFEDIVIQNNTIDAVNGPNIVVSSARNVAIQGNRFIDAQQTPPNNTGRDFGIPNDCVVYVTQSTGVKISGNQFIRPGPYAKNLVVAPAY
ncbi:MAG TPA: right-handed parallel beta-helix repeat-containing protein [Chthoniobacteraceae bacterium]|jgi:hypothetical protein|nr:right-handed parallel beta-helix repeat-containing protein [Chthoniobacteraceae bacterium]